MKWRVNKKTTDSGLCKQEHTCTLPFTPCKHTHTPSTRTHTPPTPTHPHTHVHHCLRRAFGRASEGRVGRGTLRCFFRHRSSGSASPSTFWDERQETSFSHLSYRSSGSCVRKDLKSHWAETAAAPPRHGASGV